MGGTLSEGICADQPVAADGTCPEPEGYESTESSCSDGLDNNCDGDVDCTDSDCAGNSCGIGQGTAKCISGSCKETVCHDEVDNDENGEIDCEDSDCTDEVCKRGTEHTCPEPANWKDDESACDGVDNDCDGGTDEGCDCTLDPTEDANADTDDSHDSGVCTGQTCNPRGKCARPALHESRTSAESGCGDKDNDCDGAADEGCSCTYDPTENDRTDTDGSHGYGVCPGQTRNASGVCQTPSTFEARTSSESNCDGKDNDCDGILDEGCTCTYDPNETNNVDTDGSHDAGVCPGQPRNSSGVCGTPNGFETRTNSESSCSFDDNDCDGAVDEGCSCTYDPSEADNVDTDGSNSGVCSGQTQDSNGVCPKPSDYVWPELGNCGNDTDGLDNDCDGSTDESGTLLPAGSSCSRDCACATETCTNGTCVHLMFTTSKTYIGNLGGLSGADAKCNSLASNAGYRKNWKALLSDSNTDAKGRLNINARIERVTGTKIVDGASDLWDKSLDRKVWKDETGTTIFATRKVWTGTLTNGDKSFAEKWCNDWTDSSLSQDIAVGHSHRDNYKWVHHPDDAKSCSDNYRIYCINGQ